jgi:sialic acid synthase SpsE/mannose-6-phosphate isomerase-like protein (cupin superfamily)
MVNEGIFDNLFIFELANNHMGDVRHGLRIIREISEKKKSFNFNFGFKLQYRDLDTFIHFDYKTRQDIKYIKRFSETRLEAKELKSLKDEIKKFGFVEICTPFDENSVDLVEKHDFDIIKVGSCSFTDWPLLERIIKINKPVILSTAGASFEDIDRVVSFFEHREKNFSLMHCVGEYPASSESLQLNQIDFLKKRYPEIPIGYSGHEAPDNYDAVKIAISKGSTVFEKHVGIKTDKYNLNAYSATPEQIYLWLQSAQEALKMCGIRDEGRKVLEKERLELRGLQRGVFAKRKIKKGEKIEISSVFFAIPGIENQIFANDMSKYIEFTAKKDIKKKQAILFNDVNVNNLRGRILEIINEIRPILLNSHITLPNRLGLELSHHYGIEAFEEFGAAIINCINREYCKKLIIVLPGQKHPIHSHLKKEETFHVLYGDVNINVDGIDKEFKTGDMVIIERGTKHGFSSRKGAIFEEISTTHYNDDSFYEDAEILKNNNRKTNMVFWADWFNKPIS